jgi:hypothetical protein
VAGNLYEVYKVPETFLINKQGTVIKRYIGGLGDQQVEFLADLVNLSKN